MINKRGRIESKNNKIKHYCSYIEAFNLILKLSQETLKKEYIRATDLNVSDQYFQSLTHYISVPEKIPN